LSYKNIYKICWLAATGTGGWLVGWYLPAWLADWGGRGRRERAKQEKQKHAERQERRRVSDGERAAETGPGPEAKARGHRGGGMQRKDAGDEGAGVAGR